MSTLRTVLYVGAFSAIAAASLLAASVSHAKEAEPQFWSTRCDTLKDPNDKNAKPVKYCEAFQRLAVTKKGEKEMRRVAEFAVGYPPEKKGEPRGVVVMPLGILLEQPLKMQLDEGKEFTFRVRYCDQSGCLAFLDLSQAKLEEFKKAQKLKINIPATNGKYLNVIMSLKGFGPAVDKIKP
jgi:invasion protein IalB